MLTSKQRAKLRSLASGIDPVFQVGKAGIGDTLIKQVEDALTARELIKLTVLETSPETPAQTADTLAEKTGAEVVQTIGRKVVLFRRNTKKPVIEL